MSTTIYLWMRLGGCAIRYKSAVVISGLVTFIAAYHYLRIFDSWVEAYSYGIDGSLTSTNKPFNDAYRYMDWLLTTPLLLIEIVLVMKLAPEKISSISISLSSAAILMIILGYPGSIVLDEHNLSARWMHWGASMLPFIYIIYYLLNILRAKTDAEMNPYVRDKIRKVQILTAVSWCTYPVVYVFPMLDITGSSAVVAVQIGYSIADIISKCAVGLLITDICLTRSEMSGEITSKGRLVE